VNIGRNAAPVLVLSEYIRSGSETLTLPGRKSRFSREQSVHRDFSTRKLDRIAEFRGHPCMVVSDNGTELTSHAILAWQEEHHTVSGVVCLASLKT
jgi:hypothetical protein